MKLEKKYLTIVIEYEGDKPPITGFSSSVLGCPVVALSLCNEVGRSCELQERLEELGEYVDV